MHERPGRVSRRRICGRCWRTQERPGRVSRRRIGAGESAAASVFLRPRYCHCVPLPRLALPPHPLTLLTPLQRRQHATADVAVLRCCHRRSLCAAATALPPSRCVPSPCFALPPPSLTLPPPPCRRHASAQPVLLTLAIVARPREDDAGEKFMIFFRRG